MDTIEKRIDIVLKIREQLMEKLINIMTNPNESLEKEESVKILKGTIDREIDTRLKVYYKRLQDENSRKENL